MELPKIPQTLSELLDMKDKLVAAGQTIENSASVQYLEVLIEQKAIEEAETN